MSLFLALVTSPLGLVSVRLYPLMPIELNKVSEIISQKVGEPLLPCLVPKSDMSSLDLYSTDVP